MKLELAQVVSSAWPLGVSLAGAVAAQAVHAGRRRSALNEALHELRRPLQALAFGTGGPPAGGPALEGSVQMAAAALDRLEREINGEAATELRGPVEMRPLLVDAIGRWRGHATRTGTELGLRWEAGAAALDGNRCELAQAVDNLIVNAIEHGGRQVTVEARVGSGLLRVGVRDSGSVSRAAVRLRRPQVPIARLLGRARRGHGLRVVRRVAAAHGGNFRLRRAEDGTEALLELPLRGGDR